MKHLATFILAVLIIGLWNFDLKGQVKSQREHVKSMKAGKYLTYSVGYSGNKIFYSNATEKFPFEITKIEPEPTFSKASRLTINIGDKSNEFYMPDNFAFPATYVARAYEGNKKMQEEHGYVIRKFRRQGYTPELVFLDGIGYQVYIQSPESINVKYVFVPEGFAVESDEQEGKKKKKTFGFLKNPVSKKLNEMNATDKVIEYIKAALVKQKEVATQWENSAEGKEYLANAKRVNDAMNGIINAQNTMYIKNATGKTIYVYISDSTKGTAVTNGTTVKYACGMELFYDFDGNRWRYPNKVIRISRAGVFDKCADQTGGKPYEVK